MATIGDMSQNHDIFIYRKQKKAVELGAVLAEIASKNPKCRLDIGDPDLPPPEELLETLRKVENYKYGPPEGLPEFREAVASIFGVEPSEVVATAGGRHGLAALMWTFRKKKLYTPTPYYPGYFEIASTFGLEIELVKTKEEEKWAPQFEKKGVYIVNYPNNPTGAVLSRQKVRELIDVAEFIISDEIYRDIIFGEFTSPYELAASTTAVVYSFSKIFSIPGIRLGAVIATRDVIKEVVKFNKATINVPPTPAQKAVAAAIHTLPKRKTQLSKIYAERVEIAKNSGLKFAEPGGAFYIFPKVSHGDKCYRQTLEKGISVLPGRLYGSPSHIRIALVENSHKLKEALPTVANICGNI